MCYSKGREYIIIGFLLLLLVSCGKVDEIEIQGAGNFKYKGFSANAVEFEADIKVINPSRHKIKVREINMRLMVNDMYLGRLMNAEEFEIPPLSDEYITVPFRLRINNIFYGISTISRLYNQKNLKVEVDGFVIAKTTFYRKKLEVNQITYVDSMR